MKELLKNIAFLSAFFMIGYYREKYLEKVKIKALEIHNKTLEAALDKKEFYDTETLIRISLLICEIEKSCELEIKAISKTCKIAYKKYDPTLFYDAVGQEIRKFK